MIANSIILLRYILSTFFYNTMQFRHYRGLRWEVGARFEIPRAIAVLSRTIGHDAGRFYGIRPI
jgi:hypothetical protein